MIIEKIWEIILDNISQSCTLRDFTFSTSSKRTLHITSYTLSSSILFSPKERQVLNDAEPSRAVNQRTIVRPILHTTHHPTPSNPAPPVRHQKPRVGLATNTCLPSSASDDATLISHGLANHMSGIFCVSHDPVAWFRGWARRVGWMGGRFYGCGGWSRNVGAVFRLGRRVVGFVGGGREGAALWLHVRHGRI